MRPSVSEKDTLPGDCINVRGLSLLVRISPISKDRILIDPRVIGNDGNDVRVVLLRCCLSKISTDDHPKYSHDGAYQWFDPIRHVEFLNIYIVEAGASLNGVVRGRWNLTVLVADDDKNLLTKSTCFSYFAGCMLPS
jgi:hypothetical protein